jgi:hypothetical protein
MIEAYVVVEAPTILSETTKTESSRMEKQPKLQNPPIEQELTKIASAPAITPKKGRRMANVLDAVLRPSKVATPAPTKISKHEAEDLEKAIHESIAPHCAEARPSECRLAEQVSENLPEKISLPILEAASLGDLGYIVRHALGKQLTEEQIAKVQYYVKDLKYPQGSLVYGGNDKDDYLYCLSDNKEIDVCREMMDKMGYPKHNPRRL